MYHLLIGQWRQGTGGEIPNKKKSILVFLFPVGACGHPRSQMERGENAHVFDFDPATCDCHRKITQGSGLQSQKDFFRRVNYESGPYFKK